MAQVSIVCSKSALQALVLVTHLQFEQYVQVQYSQSQVPVEPEKVCWVFWLE